MRTAIVMAKTGVDRDEAERRLAAAAVELQCSRERLHG